MPSAAETKFANELEVLGFTFERNCNDLPGTPDIVFREINLAVFFHGCFWHSHHCQKNTSSYEWSENLKKISDNDKSVLQELNKCGFYSLVIWECEWNSNPSKCISKIKGRINFVQSLP